MEIIIALIAVAVVINAIIIYTRSGAVSEEELVQEEISEYRKKYRVMNNSELALYVNLKKYIGDSHILLSKVRIEDFVEVKKEMFSKKEHWGLRGKIKSRHVDFLICDNMSKPLLAVELDGKSHLSNNRIERDRFIDELHKKIGLPIVRIPVGCSFEKESVRIREMVELGNVG